MRHRSARVPFVVHATGTGAGQRISADGREFSADAYPAFGGHDEAPSPLFYLLGALTSCQQVTAGLVARDLGLVVGAFTFDAVGELDTAVFVDGDDGNANFTTVAVRVSVESPASARDFAELTRETERRCPVTQMFRRSGLAMDTTWQQVRIPPG